MRIAPSEVQITGAAWLTSAAHTVLQIYTESLLCSGVEANIHLATRHLTLTPPTGRGLGLARHQEEGKEEEEEAVVPGKGAEFKLSYQLSVELVVSAAREYFNSATNLMDKEMDLARLVIPYL